MSEGKHYLVWQFWHQILSYFWCHENAMINIVPQAWTTPVWPGLQSTPRSFASLSDHNPNLSLHPSLLFSDLSLHQNQYHSEGSASRVCPSQSFGWRTERAGSVSNPWDIPACGGHFREMLKVPSLTKQGKRGSSEPESCTWGPLTWFKKVSQSKIIITGKRISVMLPLIALRPFIISWLTTCVAWIWPKHPPRNLKESLCETDAKQTPSQATSGLQNWRMEKQLGKISTSPQQV